MKEESLLLLSDLQKLINQVVLIDYTIIILVGNTLSKMSGHYEYTALQSNTQLGTETEMLINIIDLLVNAGNLSEIEGIKVKHLISNDKDRRL